MTDDENISEAEYSPKSEFSKPQIVEAQVQKCNDIRSKEMKSGYYNYDEQGRKIYIPDSRREWISSVKALKRLLAPEILRNKKFKEKEKEFKEKENKIFDKWSVSPMRVENNQIVVIPKSQKYIPELDETFPRLIKIHLGYGQFKNSVESISGLFNRYFNGYWNELSELYDEIYGELNKLIDANNYFKQRLSY